jgi:hypothetical protein
VHTSVERVFGLQARRRRHRRSAAGNAGDDGVVVWRDSDGLSACRTIALTSVVGSDDVEPGDEDQGPDHRNVTRHPRRASPRI